MMVHLNPASDRTAEPQGSQLPAPGVTHRLGAVDFLVLSLWCGLAAGLLEVGARVLCRWTGVARLYGMSRHFFWIVPLANLLLFAGVGLLLAMVTRCWPRGGGWLSPRVLCTFAVLPMLLVTWPQIYAEGWVFVSMGVASLIVAKIERPATGLRWPILKTLPVLLGLVAILAGVAIVPGWIKQRRETATPLPSAGLPNVLLIVLDTVRADHMSLHGYQRPTTPSLERLATRGIRFDGARATAPWTLASHASLFTGRWPGELAVQWLTPLDASAPTLAEFLGDHGYATAGFVGNTFYCSYDTGLDRGFTHYEDYELEGLAPLRMAKLVDVVVKAFAPRESPGERPGGGPFGAVRDTVVGAFREADKKYAVSINRDFLNWLSTRPESHRPFFAFLNYFDAHARYVLPKGAKYRFGLKPRTSGDYRLFEHWRDVDKAKLAARERTLIVDCYDSCLAYLDERLGELLDELNQRGVLDQTLVVVTSDHGEGLGEHDLFDHGESLYSTELRVPLMIVPPARSRKADVVRETVSLRDLPATITDLIGLVGESPFPGRSLARFWRQSSPGGAPKSDDVEEALSELVRPNPSNPNQGRSPAYRGALVSLASNDFVYIRNEHDGSEELFNERDDPGESQNRAGHDRTPWFRTRLDQIRADFTSAARSARSDDGGPSGQEATRSMPRLSVEIRK
jgi:arylsulfatase A-like enzyme